MCIYITIARNIRRKSVRRKSVRKVNIRRTVKHRGGVGYEALKYHGVTNPKAQQADAKKEKKGKK